MSALRVPLQPLEVGAHFGGVLVSQFAVFLQRPVDDVFEFGGRQDLAELGAQERGS